MGPLAKSGLIFLGAGLGANLRFWIAWWLPWSNAWSIALVNVVGGLAIGFAARAFASPDSEAWKLLIIPGLLGGFTTFSTFALDVHQLVEQGKWTQAALVIGVSVIGSILACGLGFWAWRSPAGS